MITLFHTGCIHIPTGFEHPPHNPGPGPPGAPLHQPGPGFRKTTAGMLVKIQLPAAPRQAVLSELLQ